MLAFLADQVHSTAIQIFEAVEQMAIYFVKVGGFDFRFWKTGR